MERGTTRIIVGIVIMGLAAPVGALVLPYLSGIATASLSADEQVKQISIELPPLGWSSWNSFSNTINSQIVMKQARAMVDSGMKKAGYQYINIDEGWWLGQRDANGNIVVDTKQWPALEPGERVGDMSNIVRYIHSLGLKAGIYTDAGEAGCGFYGPDLGPPMPHTGSEGHYEQDFLQFAKWGFDYVKVDWCGGSKENLDPAVQYGEIAHAIQNAENITAHRLYYSVCNWGNNSPWTWAPGIGGAHADIWRTSGDIVAPIVAGTPNSSRRAELKAVLGNFDQGVHPEAQHTGYYNDLDMMVLGMPGLNDTQNRVHMSLWAISGAPLLVGADLTKLSPTQVATLTNPDVLAIDQDALGLQGVKLSEQGNGLQIWCKVLAPSGTRAALLLNRGTSAAEMKLTWNDIGLTVSDAKVKDVWAGRELGELSAYSSQVPAGDAVLLLIRGTGSNATDYAVSSSSAELRGGATLELCKPCAAGHMVRLGGEREVRFNVPAFARPTLVEIHYLNLGPTDLMMQLRANGRLPTNILCASTGSEAIVGSVIIEIEPERSARQSTLVFSSSGGAGLALETIIVLPLGSSQ